MSAAARSSAVMLDRNASLPGFILMLHAQRRLSLFQNVGEASRHGTLSSLSGFRQYPLSNNRTGWSDREGAIYTSAPKTDGN